jgi:tetratricopeptide (TPR) repeat protein
MPERSPDLQALIEDATLDFSLGDGEAALQKLDDVLERDGGSFDAWLARAEVLFSLGRHDEALQAAQQAHALRSGDIHVNTSLSRIWLELGSKEKAEHFGAQARILGWKDRLKQPPPSDPVS